MRERILITGGAGFLGSTLADRLASQGEDVLILDALARSGATENRDWLVRRHPGRIGVLEADIRDRAALAEVTRISSAVLHLAGQTGVTASVANPLHDFNVNALGTFQLLEAFRQADRVVPFLFASTNKVYGGLEHADGFMTQNNRMGPLAARLTMGVNESEPLDFHTPFACSKGAADQYVRDYARMFGMPTVVLRMSCVYGPHQYGTEDQGWIAHFLNHVREGWPVTLHGDGMQVRDALFADDAAAAWLAVLSRIGEVRGGVFNLGGGPENSTSLNEALGLIANLTGKTPNVRHGPARPGDPPWYVSDTRALSQATGWLPRTSIPQGLGVLNDWFNDRAAGKPA